MWTRIWSISLSCSVLGAQQAAASRYNLQWRQFPSCVEEFLRKPKMPWIPNCSSHYSVLALSNARSDLASRPPVNGREGSPWLPPLLFLPFPLQWCCPQSQRAEDVPLPPDARTQSPSRSPSCLHMMELAWAPAQVPVGSLTAMTFTRGRYQTRDSGRTKTVGVFFIKSS